jgi:Kef-type K+ transport system membrane component KefB
MTAAELNVRLLLAVAVVIVGVQTVGWFASRAGQPRVIGEIVAGVLLGPSLLGLVLPATADYLFPAPVVDGLRILSQFGLVLFLFLVGLHLHLPSLRGSSRTVLAVSQASIVVPFGLAAGLAALVYAEFGAGVDPVAFCVFLGSAMSVTALPVLARILADVGLDRDRIGVVSLACAAINDITAWCLIALVVALIGAPGPFGAVTTVALAVTFVAVMLLAVRPLLARLPDLPIWAVLVVAAISAWTAEQIGVHSIIGAFIAGLVMPRRARWQQQTHDRLDVVVRNLLLPIFFVVAGLGARVDRIAPSGLLVALAVIGVAIIGKLGAATVAARLAGESWSDSWTVGVLMNTRGVTELVILNLGLQLDIIDTTVYTVMVLMTLVTTLMTAPLLSRLRSQRSPVPAAVARS